MKSDKKSQKKQVKQKEPLTTEGFYKILNKVIRPVSEKPKPPKKEKQGTSE